MQDLLLQLKAAAEDKARILAICAYSELTVTELTHVLGQSQPGFLAISNCCAMRGCCTVFEENAMGFLSPSRQAPKWVVAVWSTPYSFKSQRTTPSSGGICSALPR